MTSQNQSLADDVLRGAEAIAQFTGDDPRRIYYLGTTGALPIFKIGDSLCMRKSRYLQMVEELENASLAQAGK